MIMIESETEESNATKACIHMYKADLTTATSGCPNGQQQKYWWILTDIALCFEKTNWSLGSRLTILSLSLPRRVMVIYYLIQVWLSCLQNLVWHHYIKAKGHFYRSMELQTLQHLSRKPTSSNEEDIGTHLSSWSIYCRALGHLKPPCSLLYTRSGFALSPSQPASATLFLSHVHCPYFSSGTLNPVLLLFPRGLN